MPGPAKNRERDKLLARLRELDQKIAENERELWELKKRQAARLSPEDQLAFYLQEAIGSVSPEFVSLFRVIVSRRRG